MNTAKGSIDDIVSLLDPKSLIRSAFKGRINLGDNPLPTFSPDRSYTTLEINIAKKEDTLNYAGKIAKICEEGRHTGKQERFHAGVNEAFRNAYQHGNKKDPYKKVTISYRATEENFEVVVSDQGGEINADFIPFILLHRYKQLGQPLDFYQFSGTKKPSENSGVGTFVIHVVSDEVNYFRNSDGGLSVQMIIKKGK